MVNIQSNNQDMKIISPKDCDNAPKKRILKEFIIACAKKDIDFITEHTLTDINWTIVNDTTLLGREEVIHTLVNKMPKQIIEIELTNIITHGHTAAANGVVKFEDDRIYSFCNVYRFVSPGKNTLKEITSYVIKNE